MYTDAIEQWTRDNGATVAIYPDTDTSSPADWDVLGDLYVSGRDQYREGSRWHVLPDNHEVETYIRANRIAGNIVLPFSYYDHGSSGTTLRATNDENANGYIVAEKDAPMVRDELNAGGDIESVLRSELETWSQWLNGDVYGFVIENPAGDNLESVWGFYGYDYAVAEANSTADNMDAETIYGAEREHVRTYA